MGCTSPTTKRFPEAREMSRGRSPRDISRAEGNLEVGGDVQPNTSRLEAVYGHSLIINPYQGMYQEIHPCMAGSIDSVKINTSLLMMREWSVLYSQGVGLSCCDMEYRQIVQWLQHNLEHKNGMCGVTY